MASKAWTEYALRVVEELARRAPTLTADDLRVDLARHDAPPPEDGRAHGTILAEAERRGWIAKDEDEKFRPTTLGSSHGSPRRVWRSLVYDAMFTEGPPLDPWPVYFGETKEVRSGPRCSKCGLPLAAVQPPFDPRFAVGRCPEHGQVTVRV